MITIAVNDVSVSQASNRCSIMKNEISPAGVSALFEQASRLIHGLGFAEGLTPAQWVALRYFAEAPPFSRTMASLARYQGLTLAHLQFG